MSDRTLLGRQFRRQICIDDTFLREDYSSATRTWHAKWWLVRRLLISWCQFEWAFCGWTCCYIYYFGTIGLLACLVHHHLWLSFGLVFLEIGGNDQVWGSFRKYLFNFIFLLSFGFYFWFQINGFHVFSFLKWLLFLDQSFFWQLLDLSFFHRNQRLGYNGFQGHFFVRGLDELFFTSVTKVQKGAAVLVIIGRVSFDLCFFLNCLFYTWRHWVVFLRPLTCCDLLLFRVRKRIRFGIFVVRVLWAWHFHILKKREFLVLPIFRVALLVLLNTFSEE